LIGRRNQPERFKADHALPGYLTKYLGYTEHIDFPYMPTSLKVSTSSEAGE